MGRTGLAPWMLSRAMVCAGMVKTQVASAAEGVCGSAVMNSMLAPASRATRIRAVTVDDCLKVAREYLVDENSVTGILKPSQEQTSRIEEKPLPAASNDKS